MSPLQKWMTEHGHPGWYSWLVVLGGAFTSMLVAVGISVSLNNRALARDRAQDQAVAEAKAIEQERALLASCLVIRRMQAVYSDPETETGRDAAVAWKDLGKIFGCKE